MATAAAAAAEEEGEKKEEKEEEEEVLACQAHRLGSTFPSNWIRSRLEFESFLHQKFRKNLDRILKAGRKGSLIESIQKIALRGSQNNKKI